MNKKIIGVIIAIILICGIGLIIFSKLNTKDLKENGDGIDMKESKNDLNDNKENNITKTSNGKILVVYYSASNNTKSVAEKIALNLNADLFEIEPEQKYTTEDLDWTNENSRVSKEHNDESLRDVKLKNSKVDNWDNYDTVLIGFPIWWSVSAWPVNSFVKANDFKNKTVIPFCTSASSGLGQSGKLLEKDAGNGDWKDGHRFNQSPSDSDIKSFTDSI